MKKNVVKISALALTFGACSSVYAAATQLNLPVTDGIAAVDIVTDTGTPVASPSFTFISAVTTSFSDSTISVHNIGKPGQNIVLWNPTVDPSWSVTLGATGGATAKWLGAVGQNAEVTGLPGSGGTCDSTGESTLVWNDASGTGTGTVGEIDNGECFYSIPFNEAVAAGNGYLTVNASGAVYEATISPTDGTIVNPIETTSPTGVTAATGATFSGATQIQIFAADGTADDYSVFTLRNISLTQNVPALQEADTYSLDMTLTLIP